MDMPFDPVDLERAERFLAAGELETAVPLLEELASAVDDCAQESCQATDRIQWFSFADAFERLAYRRVERDPRALEQAPLPFDRVYADLAFGYIRLQRWEAARDALMQAVRWNPMNCDYRLDLAEVFLALGDTREWAALSHSVLDRASDSRSLARAYANLGRYFLDMADGSADGDPTEASPAGDAAEEKGSDAERASALLAASACERLASRLAADDPRVGKLSARMEEEHPALADESDEAALRALERQGVSANPNAEIAICLLMCASDAASAGDRDQAARYTLRARDLIGQEACAALIQLIHESDAELAREKTAADPDGHAPADAAASSAKEA